MRPLFALAALVLLAGCSSPSAAPAHSDPIVVTAPDDYSYLNQTDPWSRPHLHDYWGGQTRKTVMDADIPVVNLSELHVGTDKSGFDDKHFGSGEVVPQGTRNVTFQMVHEKQPGDVYGKLTMSYRTAAAPSYSQEFDLADGPVQVEIAPDDADLPHQSVSAWRIQFYIYPEVPGGPTAISGSIHTTVTAERGYPIPLFPGHPDPWKESAELLVLHDERALYDSRAYDCASVPALGNCYFLHLPPPGSTIPYNASLVRVELAIQQPTTPLGLRLAFHGADTWDFTTVPPTEQGKDRIVYEIPVSANGDSPYATRSVWEFQVTAKDDALDVANYQITVTAFKDLVIGPP